MDIAVIGKGNVGAALARGWLKAGHRVRLGVRDPEALQWDGSPGPEIKTVQQAAGESQIIVIAVPATAAADVGTVLKGIRDIENRTIVDATNSIFRSPEGYESSYAALRSLTGADVIKCFNCTGAENMQNPAYPEGSLDMFMAGGSAENQEKVRTLARDLGFAECYSSGGPETAPLLENMAALWIGMSGQSLGRNFGFRLVRR